MSWLSRLFGIGRRRKRRTVHLEGDGTYECEVVGESNYQDALEWLVGGKTPDGHEFHCYAMLELEPTNPHDRHAVMVSIDGRLVGYLNRGHAKTMTGIFRKYRLSAARADALIVGGWTRRKSRKSDGHFGVRLDVPV